MRNLIFLTLALVTIMTPVIGMEKSNALIYAERHGNPSSDPFLVKITNTSCANPFLEEQANKLLQLHIKTNIINLYHFLYHSNLTHDDFVGWCKKKGIDLGS